MLPKESNKINLSPFAIFPRLNVHHLFVILPNKVLIENLSQNDGHEVLSKKNWTRPDSAHRPEWKENEREKKNRQSYKNHVKIIAISNS